MDTKNVQIISDPTIMMGKPTKMGFQLSHRVQFAFGE